MQFYIIVGIKGMKKRRKEKIIESYPEIHQSGYLSIEKCIPKSLKECDFGVQIAEDGRIWVCVDGDAFLRFKPATEGFRRVR